MCETCKIRLAALSLTSSGVFRPIDGIDEIDTHNEDELER